jgi:WD40 repeat protein
LKLLLILKTKMV